MKGPQHMSITVEEAQRRIDTLREMAGDPEVAYSVQDELWEQVLRTIAEEDPSDIVIDTLQLHYRNQELAQTALKAVEIQFPRWKA